MSDVIPKLYIARTVDGNGFALPAYRSRYHAGLLLQAAIGSTLKINAGERIRIPVGFAIGVPQGYCGQIVSTPELAEEHGLIVSDAPYILNPANREPVFVLIQNVSSNPYVLHRGEVIAELLIMPVVQVGWNEIQTIRQEETTDMAQEVLDPGAPDETQPAKDPFASFRRKKTSPRNRFKSDDDDE